MRAATANAAACIATLLVLAGCASTRPEPPRSLQGSEIAAAAAALIGTRYRFGGADGAGFDCSGLALYVHERVGLAIPRTAAEQQRAALAVPIAELTAGDLVFFHMHGSSIDHVGIYAGEGRFIHAPRAGGAVGYADLRSGFYARHLAAAGRFWGAARAAR
ncbi:MAG TPA: C40 family peptidase [Steroidobacteraceae bacterium]|nr:C40 family peptidase [Steroidobacteraceae bacterium]